MLVAKPLVKLRQYALSLHVKAKISRLGVVRAFQFAAKIVRLIREGAVSETRIQNYAEVFADDLVPVSFLGAASTMVLGRNMQAAASMPIPTRLAAVPI